jgi:sugar (pentulose or hexulose) kinase
MRAAGIELREIRAVGGGAKSPLWLQTKADILDMPIVTLECKEAGCLGAAALAAVGSGVYPDIQTAVKAMVRIEQTHMPQAQNAARYAEKYAVYKTLYPALKSIQAQL